MHLASLSKWIRLLISLIFFLSFLSRNSFAQFGLAGILNPEGSRLFPQTLVLPRHPGKPDLRWTDFDWKYTDRNVNDVRYRLYFYTKEEWIAQLALPRIEEQIVYLSRIFNYKPSRQFYYLLLGSRREFEQINIFNISEGVQGITSTTEQTMAIPYWGEAETFRHISTHEMTHQFEVQKVNDLAGTRSNVVLNLIPLWFTEGMAEYYSLGGIEPETKQFIRDLLLYPKPEEEYKVTKFFETGPMDFVHVYKLGQAKIDFLEKEFGAGTTQKILTATARELGQRDTTFESITTSLLQKDSKEIEKRWSEYLFRVYQVDSKTLSQTMNEFELVPGVGDTIDSYSVSPDGKLLAYREIDPLSGVVSIRLRRIDREDEVLTVTKDHQSSALSLYFMQVPVLTLSNHWIAYVVGTTRGPELDVCKISYNKNESVQLGDCKRVLLHKLGFTEANSPTLSSDERSLAFIGFIPKGWTNVYEIRLPTNEESSHWDDFPDVRELTNSYYSWRTISWEDGGILGSSDRTATGKYNIFYIDPRSTQSDRTQVIVSGSQDLLAPTGSKKDFVFQSWRGGSSQIHRRVNGKEYQLTEAKIGLTNPQYRQGKLYALGLKGGRYRLYQIPEAKLLKKEIPPETEISEKPWEAHLVYLPKSEIQTYKPLITSGSIRLDDLGAFFSTGLIAGVSASVSDLMRDYSLSGQFSYLGNYGLTNTFLVLSSSKGRPTWSLGGYNILQPRVDNIYSNDNVIRTYVYREFGAVGAYQYPLGTFSFIDVALRVAGANRKDYSDPALAASWETYNPGSELVLVPVFRIGYDEILYEALTGPLRGYGILVESETNIFPTRTSDYSTTNERVRLDVAYYFQPTGRTVIALQGVAGASWGGLFRNSFLISSDDILRGYPVFDPRLFGNYVLASRVEFRFPIGSLFNFPYFRGLFAFDYGSVAQRPQDFPDRVGSSYTFGLSFNIPPISMAFMLSQPIRAAAGPSDNSVFHFVLRYLYF